MTKRSNILLASVVAIAAAGGGVALASGLGHEHHAHDSTVSSRSSRTATSPSRTITGAPTPGRTWVVDGVTCSAQTCVAFGTSPTNAPVIWWSNDHGVTFHPSSGDIPTTTFLQSAACQATTCVVTGENNVTPQGVPVAFASTDGGRTFAATSLPEARGPDQLTCSATLCVLAEHPLPTGGEAPVFVAPHPLGPWTQLHLPLAAAVVPGTTNPTTNILTSTGLGSCTETGPCLVANVTSSIMGVFDIPEVWELTGPTSTPVVVAKPLSSDLISTSGWLSCSIETCALLQPQSNSLSLTVVRAATHTTDLLTMPSSASFDELLDCVRGTCIVVSPSKSGPTLLWRASAHGLVELHNPVPAWIQIGPGGVAEPTRGTFLVPAPAHDGSQEASLLRISLSATGVTPEGFITLPST